MVPEVHLQIIFKSPILISQLNLFVTVAEFFSPPQSQSQEYPFAVLHTNFLAFTTKKPSKVQAPVLIFRPSSDWVSSDDQTPFTASVSVWIVQAWKHQKPFLYLRQYLVNNKFLITLHQVQDFFHSPDTVTLAWTKGKQAPWSKWLSESQKEGRWSGDEGGQRNPNHQQFCWTQP